MNFTIPEAYEALAKFGMDAMERQKLIVKDSFSPEAHESGE